jgi:putative tricarboxylic transport membrane protein
MEEKGKKSLFVKNTKIAADFIIAIVIIAIAIVFYVESLALPTKTQGIGPGVYPQFICIILFFLGIVQIIKCILMVRGIPVIDVEKVNKKGLLRVLIMVVATYLLYKLMKPVGFPIVAPIYLFFAICFFGYKNKIKAAIFSVVFTTALYFLFTKVFLVMLPAGILG